MNRFVEWARDRLKGYTYSQGPQPVIKQEDSQQTDVTQNRQQVEDDQQYQEDGQQTDATQNGQQVEYITAEDIYRQYAVVETAGGHSLLQNWWIKFGSLIGAVLIWVIAGLGVSEWLTGFHPLTWDFWVIVNYIAGFGYEFLGIALLFVAAREKDKKRWGYMWGALIISLFVAFSSFIAQYFLLFSELQRNMLDFPTQALAGLPVNKYAIFLFRAAIPIALEFSLVFLVAQKRPDVHETISQRRQLQNELHQLQDDEAFAKQMAQARAAVLEQFTAASQIASQQMKFLKDNNQLMIQELRPRTIVQRVIEQQPMVEAPQKSVPLEAPVSQTSGEHPVVSDNGHIPDAPKNIVSEKSDALSGVDVQSSTPPEKTVRKAANNGNQLVMDIADLFNSLNNS